MRALAVLLACCGGSTTPPVATTSGPPAAFIAVPAAGDVQVATVEGRPVWGSCVADQLARKIAATREVALAQCIDLELLSQQAERFAGDPEVVDATRTALVRRLMDGFEAKYPGPESLRPQIDALFAKAGTHTRPELRTSFHALVMANKDAPEATHVEARRAAEQIHQRIGNELGLFPAQVREATEAVKTSLEIKLEDVAAMPKDNRRYAAAYVGALFAIPDVGRVSPVIKSDFGYHVILMTDRKAETEIDREQVFGGLRRQLFAKYVTDLMATTRIEVADLPAGDEAP